VRQYRTLAQSLCRCYEFRPSRFRSASFSRPVSHKNTVNRRPAGKRRSDRRPTEPGFAQAEFQVIALAKAAEFAANDVPTTSGSSSLVCRAAKKISVQHTPGFGWPRVSSPLTRLGRHRQARVDLSPTNMAVNHNRGI